MGDVRAETSSHIMTVSARTVSVRIGSHLWPRWTRIAIQHECWAQKARSNAEAANEDRGSNFSAALSDELDAAMESISAAAHALDTYYGAVKRHIVVPPATWAAWQRNGTARRKRVLETLKLGFTITGPTAEEWAQDFRWLYRLRGDAVHYVEGSKEVTLHPLGCYTAPEHIAYSVESSGRALDLVLEVLETCTLNPKPNNRALRSYAENMTSEVQRLVQMRTDAVN